MKKNSHLLTDLKKQVLILKTQLDNIQRSRPNQNDRSNNSINRSALSQSSRFNTSSFDSTYLDRGVKKFPLQQNRFKNLSQLISQKSKIEKQPRFSQYRMAQDAKTRENFSTDKRQCITNRSKSPNPLTGEGYTQRRKGIKTNFESSQNHNKERPQSSFSGRKHYPLLIYR